MSGKVTSSDNFMASTKTVRMIQLLLLVLIVAAAVRVIVILRQRSEPAVARAKPVPSPPLNREAYMVPRKLHISNLKSAQQLTQQPLWVKEGYRYTVYPYAKRAADWKHPAGMLLPLEKLQIMDVVSTPASKSRQVVAVFDQDGKTYAVPIGLQEGSDFTFYADEMFFYEDPHELYNFWPAETWQAIERHEITRGMNEYQVAFSVGMGVPQAGGDSGQKAVNYPNGGKPLVVTYRNGEAIDIKPGS
jgi:hypothetical protein